MSLSVDHKDYFLNLFYCILSLYVFIFFLTLHMYYLKYRSFSVLLEIIIISVGSVNLMFHEVVW